MSSFDNYWSFRWELQKYAIIDIYVYILKHKVPMTSEKESGSYVIYNLEDTKTPFCMLSQKEE